MKQKKWLLTTLTACAVAFSAAFVGCKKNSTEKPLEEGPETGTYYLEDEFGENLLTLSGGEYFTFTYRGKDASGTYTLEDGVLTLDFNKDEDGEATGAFEDATVSITYNGASLRLLRKKYYQVTFETNGGSQVAAKAVLNGKTLAKPADPEKAGNKFIAWYTTPDCSGMPFSFETDAVTEDTKLYALWAPYDAASAEFEVKFDLGYDGMTLASATTVGGKLYNVANPVRDGYVFNGWWMSSYNDGAKLTAEYTADYAFAADTTLFALWTAEGENAMLLSVDVNGAKWTGVTKAATITVEGPNGLKSTETVGTTAGNAYGYDFSTKPAGDYKVTLESDGKKVERYYLNNALLRASGFRVVGNAVLMFNPVAGAEKYLVSVDCGDARHNHTEVDNGLSTNFNFVNCPMKKGGIVFTVKAVAAGKASSVATYTFDRTLAKVENLAYNAENGLLTWNAVREAAEYVVCVGDEEFNVGNNTEFSLKGYTGELEIKVVCKTDGYNESEAAELTLDKTTPVAPANLAVNGDDLTWDAAENATGYVVRIGSNEYETADATFALGEKLIEINNNVIPAIGSDYTVTVKARFKNSESLWSDALDIRYYALDKSLKYDRGVLTWNYVVGATEYEVTVNGKAYKTASNEYAVTLTQSGENVITVKFITADGADDETAMYTVNAYKLDFDAMQGGAVSAVYRAVGDPMNLPVTEREGYDFAGWFNSASTTGVNGKQYSGEYFYASTDLVLYAGWTPKTYSVRLDYNLYGTGNVDSAEVTYTKDYNITPPVVSAQYSNKIFAGWYSSADGKGVKYTDELGNSLIPWQHTSDMVLYACYNDAFKYTEMGKGYEVVADRLLSSSKIEELTIPATYNGKKVISVGEYAFQDCRNIKVVKIPDSVTFIASTAFYNCTKIEKFVVYETGEANPVYFTVDDSLLYNNTITGATELVCVPSAMSGTYKIPYGVTRLGSRNFYKSGLTEIVVPASVTEVAKEAFLSCSNLTKLSFDMPEGEQKLVSLTLADNAISGCANIAVLNLPARVKTIDNITETFNQYKNLKEINIVGECDNQIYSSLTEKDGVGANGILTNADKSEIIFCPLKKEFKAVSENGTVVYEFEVPNTVTKIGANAFNMYRQTSESKNTYYQLNRIIFHSGVVSIGENAFLNMRYLKSVTFKEAEDPLGIVIGDSAFYNCNNLAQITFEETGSLNGTEFVATKTCGITTIGKKAFSKTAVNAVVLPNSLKTINEGAFEDCNVLMNIDFSHVDTNLVYGAHVFADCDSITEVTITDNVGPMEFNSVFYKCGKLGKVEVSPNNKNYESVNGVLYSKGRETLLYYPDGLTGEVAIDPATKRIGGGVFSKKNNIIKIVIPAGVIEIGENAFEGCANLSEVTFEAPAGDQTTASLRIGDRAFADCTALTEIIFPARTVSLGNGIFNFSKASDSKLASVTLQEGLETIGNNAFYNCAALTAITIPSTVTAIGQRAFYKTALTEVTFADGDGELTLGDYVFAYCQDLETITLREGTKNVPAYAFYYDTKLTSVVIPTTVANDDNNGVRAIGYRSFVACESLSDVRFTLGGDLPLSFAESAFVYCSALTTLNLPKRASSVNPSDYDVFEYGNGTGLSSTLANVVFCGNDIIEAGNPYSPTKKVYIQNVNVVEEGGEYASYNGVLYNADKTIVIWVPYAKTGNVEVAKEATSFRDGAFYGCTYVTSVTFQKGGTEPFVMKDADSKTGVATTKHVFFACPNLTSIIFPARLESLGAYALYTASSSREIYGTGLSEIGFEDGCNVTKIGDYAFANTLLTEFTLPASVTTVGKKVLSGCSALESLTLSVGTTSAMLANLVDDVQNLKTVTIPEGNQELLTDEKGVVYDVDKTQIAYVPYGFDAEEYIIPASVEKIGAKAFQNRKSLKKIVFASAAEGEDEKSLTIDASAFENSGLTSVTLPKRLSTMGSMIFKGCSDLAEVDFEPGFKCTIPTAAFHNCVSLTEIRIPGDVTVIGSQAFENANRLTLVTLGITDDKSAGSQLVRIGSNAFKDCQSLVKIQMEQYSKNVDTGEEKITYLEKLPDSLSQLGTTDSSTTSGNGPFTNCSSLVSITIPNRVSFIANSAFTNCTELTTVNLPQSLTIIYSSAFSGCGKLTAVNFNSGTEPASVKLQQQAFKDCKKLASFDFSKISTFMGKAIFNNCTSLTSVNIHDAMDVGTLADMFAGCTSLSTVTFTPDKGNIGGTAFRGCTNLTTVTIGGSVATIGTNAFDGCENLATVNVLSNLTTINKQAFYNCAKLTNMTFSPTLTSIGESAFEGTTKLSEADFSDVANKTGLTINKWAFKNSGIATLDLGTNASTTSKAVVNITTNAFEGCVNLTTVTIPDSFAKGKLGIAIFKDCTSLTTVIYDTVLDIPGSMFSGCTELTGFTINKGFAAVGEFAFRDCTKAVFTVADGLAVSEQNGVLYSNNKVIGFAGAATNIKIKDGTTAIADYAFSGASGLAKVVLPESLTTIGKQAFEYSGIQEINLEDLETFGSYMFKQCENLQSVKLSATTISAHAFDECVGLQTVELMGSNVVIMDGAFRNCSSLNVVKGTEKVVALYSYAFADAIKTMATTMDFPNAVIYGSSAFKNATRLTSVRIKGTYKDGTKQIVQSTFYGCESLTSVSTVETIELINGYAFQDCKLLTLDTLDLSKVQKIGSKAFAGCESLVTLSLPSVVALGTTSTASVTANATLFTGCVRLKAVSFGEDLTILPRATFEGCTELSDVVMPGVTQIGESAFSGCTKIASLTLTNKITKVNQKAFDGWTEDQTINLPDFVKDEVPSGWNAKWNLGCNAKMVWKAA